jgi:2-methylfumaryl-CoA isomerase
MTDTSTPPLSGLRILDLSTYVAGPSGAMTLAQLGAEVIRIDPVGGAADTRRLPLDQHGHSLYWAGLNKAKKSIEIDTRSAEGQALVKRLLVASGPEGGIVLTNAIGQDWLSYDVLRRQRSDLILIHILGHADGTAAVDYTVNSEVGLPLLTGPVDFDRPVNHVLPAWDLLTGLHAALAILTADRVRARTRQGNLVRIALADVAATTMAHLGFVADVALHGQARLRDGNYLYGSFGCDFRTADDERVMVVALTDRHWRKLVELTATSAPIEALETSLRIDMREEATRYRFREVLAALFAPWFAGRTLKQVETDLDAHQILWGPYRTVEQLVHDPDSVLNLSGLFSPVIHPGIGPFPTPQSVLRFADSSTTSYPSAAPAVGADTDDVLTQLLEIPPLELADLRERNIIGGPLI